NQPVPCAPPLIPSLVIDAIIPYATKPSTCLLAGFGGELAMTEDVRGNDTPSTDGGSSEVVTYEVRGDVAIVRLNRPEYRNAQNSKVTYALDAAYTRAVNDDNVKVIVLGGNGK